MISLISSTQYSAVGGENHVELGSTLLYRWSSDELPPVARREIGSRGYEHERVPGRVHIGSCERIRRRLRGLERA